ncbi:UNVERIFIED_CONTAM: hypothetical protein Sindi_1680900, partial [Sesamum indicum]
GLSVPRATLSQYEVWGPIMLPGVPTKAQGDAPNSECSNTMLISVRGREDAPIIILDSTVPPAQMRTRIVSWDAVEHVVRGDGGPPLARNTSLAAQRSLDIGSKVGDIESWTNYIRRFGVQSDRGAQTNNEGDSTTRSHQP